MSHRYTSTDPRRARFAHAALALALAAGTGVGIHKFCSGPDEIVDRTREPTEQTSKPCRSLEHCIAAAGELQRLPYYDLIENGVRERAARRGIGHRTRHLIELAYAIIDRESRFDRLAVGDAGDLGLMQVVHADIRERYGPRFDELQARYPLWARRGTADREAYVREVAPLKNAIRADEAARLQPARNTRDGTRILVDCGVHAEETMRHGKYAHEHTPEEDAQWRKLTMAYYNGGQHGIDRHLARIPARQRGSALAELQKLKGLPARIREYVRYTDKQLLYLRERTGTLTATSHLPRIR